MPRSMTFFPGRPGTALLPICSTTRSGRPSPMSAISRPATSAHSGRARGRRGVASGRRGSVGPWSWWSSWRRRSSRKGQGRRRSGTQPEAGQPPARLPYRAAADHLAARRGQREGYPARGFHRARPSGQTARPIDGHVSTSTSLSAGPPNRARSTARGRRRGVVDDLRLASQGEEPTRSSARGRTRRDRRRGSGSRCSFTRSYDQAAHPPHESSSADDCSRWTSANSD